MVIYDLLEYTFKNRWKLRALAWVLVIDGTQCEIWPIYDRQSCLCDQIEVVVVLIQENKECIIDRHNQIGEEALKFFLILDGALNLKWHFRIVDMLKQEEILFDRRIQICAKYDGLNLFDEPERASSFLFKWWEWRIDELLKMLAFQVLICLYFEALNITKQRFQLSNFDFVINWPEIAYHLIS